MLRSLSIAVLLLAAQLATAQKIPDSAIDEFCEAAKSDGYTIERIIKPDLTKPHPNEAMYWDGPCYPGKTVIVSVLFAAKPQDLFFKIQVYTKLIEQSGNLNKLTIRGTEYWNDFRAAKFGPEYANYKNTTKCLTLFAYDKKALDLPVYVIIMTKK